MIPTKMFLTLELLVPGWESSSSSSSDHDVAFEDLCSLRSSVYGSPLRSLDGPSLPRDVVEVESSSSKSCEWSASTRETAFKLSRTKR